MTNAEPLKTKLAEWHDWLNGKDEHSVAQQLYGTLIWSGFYRCINESRNKLPRDDRDRPLANGWLHQLLDAGYATLHASAIRRLVDTGPSSGPRGVRSLTRLILDIADHAQLLTRKNMLEARALIYDFQPMKDQAQEQAYEEARTKGESAYCVSTTGWLESECWHDLIDKLCGVQPANRSPADCPTAESFHQLHGDLIAATQPVKDYVDKFIAHAAAPASRNMLPSGHQALKLKSLWSADIALLRAAHFLRLYVVEGADGGAVPIPQHDHLKHLEQPFAAADAIPVMKEVWKNYCHEMEEHQQWFWDQPL